MVDATATVVAVNDETFTRVVNVDSKKLGNVIGPKGATLNSIQDLLSVRIQVPKGGSGNTTPVTITGTLSDKVAAGAKAVSDLASKGYSGLLLEADAKGLLKKSDDAVVTTAVVTPVASAQSDPNATAFIERSMQIPSR